MNDKNTLKFDNPVTKSFDSVAFESKRYKDEDDINIDDARERIYFKRDIIFGQFINFVNYFAQIGGFDSIIEYLKAGSQAEERIPIEMISLISSAFKNCNQIFSEEFAKHFITNFKDILLFRLANMTEKELKEIDKETVGRVLQEMKDFFMMAMDNTSVA